MNHRTTVGVPWVGFDRRTRMSGCDTMLKRGPVSGAKGVTWL
jgi:hypothetical protein